MKTTAKKGRPTAFHRTSWGDIIDGLTRLADGRWKVSGKPPIKFTEPDERLAVARFHQIVASRTSNKKRLMPVGSSFDPVDAMRRGVKATKSALVFRIPKPGHDAKPISVEQTFDTQALWGWLREQIMTQPKWVAERVGIEQIGYLQDVHRPTVAPKLSELGDLYASKPGLSKNEAGRSRTFWAEFSKAVGVETVDKITHDHVTAYETIVTGKGYAPKSILHRYRKVRTILAFAIKRGRGAEHCRKALDATAMLEVKDAHPVNPKPISPEHFWAIHGAAVEAGDEVFAALLLVALNCCLYGGEAGSLRWEEIDLKRGEVVSRRSKTGVVRVGILWPETIAALKKLPQDRPHVFNTRIRNYTAFSVLDSWRRYRTAAGVSTELVPSGIRDAAFTAACRANLDAARLLAGHRLPGASDAYLMRRPQAVAEACAAIRSEFFPSGMRAKRSG